MKILLTGSGGFIGKNLKKALEDRFQGVEIVSLKRAGVPAPGEHLVNYSDAKTLIDCKACKDVNYAFHLAGITKAVRFKDFYNANVIPTENLLNALKQKSPDLERFIFASSQAAAGPSRNRQHYKTEQEEANPVEYYGETNLMAEEIVQGYASFLPCTTLRIASVYGPGDEDFKKIFKMAKSGINIYAGNKKKIFSYIYVEDLVEGMISSALSKNTVANTYFICNDEPITWQQMHETVFSVMNKKPISISIPFPIIKALSYLGDAHARISGNVSILNVQKIKLAEPDYWIASNQKAKKDFGFNPHVSLEQGVQRTYEYYLRNKHL
ncbi:NAD(P)-dependent oxidoreductase [Candidatus Woesearchaeota archaeon]|nr:NAD(P)-dependent oxidoreductase [Candidatus Woesearchaeota archaeon]